MKKILLALAIPLALCLSACQGLGGLLGPGAPAPLAQTTVDDRALETAWKSFDVALDAINVLADRGIIVAGSPTARSIAAAIRKVNRALGAAERFAAAGSSVDYATALREAAAGFTELRALITGGGQ